MSGIRRGNRRQTVLRPVPAAFPRDTFSIYRATR